MVISGFLVGGIILSSVGLKKSHERHPSLALPVDGNDGGRYMSKIRTLVLVVVVTLLSITAGAQTAAKGKSLYDRIGGKPAITAVVDEFVARVAADNRINHFFAATASNPAQLASFKMKLVDQICEAAGGPCKYQGKDMKTAHQGMGISAADFNALV